jgi:endo-1,4-beta-xylanase
MKPLAILLLVTALAQGQTTPTLKDAYKGLFLIGVAVNAPEFEGRDLIGDRIIESQFDQISPENALKWQSVHPSTDTYNFDEADKYVAFGQKHKMFIVGHCLVWHSQTPRSVFVDDDGKPLTRDGLLQRMHDHIRKVVGRYKGRIGGWDVVNEALNEDGTMRQSLWYKIIGDDFIAKAFEYAHEADPNAELYYNDYSLEGERKRKGAVELIRKLKAAGVPITGIGLQGHVHLDTPDAKTEAETIEAFAALGLKVNISELDVDVLPRTARTDAADISATAAATADSNPYIGGLPEEMQQALAKRYGELFRVFVDHHASMGRVTLWGATDRDSWLNNFPTRGRTNYPLLFDRQGKPKPAFDAVLQAARTSASQSSSKNDPKDEWVGSWASSPQLVEPQNRPPPPGLAGNTLRQVVHLTAGGAEIRLRLSNEFGTQVMTLESVHVAIPVSSAASIVKGAPGSGAEGVIPTTGEIRPGTDTAVTFGGRSSVTLQPGSFVLSDPIALRARPLSDLAVTFVGGKIPDGITGHPGSRATSFLAAGNAVSSATLPNAVSFDHWYVLDGVDVRGMTSRGSVVALGDSITDGRGSITNGNTRWPDFLARRLNAEAPAANVGVLNEGIGGNCILHGGLGPTAVSRFDRDVIGQSGVKWVLIFEGVNDIGGTRAAAQRGEVSTVADAIILSLEQFIAKAHAHGIRAYGATITPFGHSGYDSPSTEADRAKVNHWIRTSGKFDGVIDFDKAVRDQQAPTVLDAGADSGDHLHLSSEGYKRMAAAIDLGYFSQ